MTKKVLANLAVIVTIIAIILCALGYFFVQNNPSKHNHFTEKDYREEILNKLILPWTRVRIIVGVKGDESFDPDERASKNKKLINSVLSNLTDQDFKALGTFDTPFFVGEVSKSGMKKLIQDKRVTSIREDGNSFLIN